MSSRDLKLNIENIIVKSDEYYRVIASKDDIPIPGGIIPINAESLTMTSVLEEAHENDRNIILLAKKNKHLPEKDENSFYIIGAVGRVIQVLKIPSVGVKALIQPVKRIKVLKFNTYSGDLYAKVESYIMGFAHTTKLEPLLRIVKGLYKEYTEYSKSGSDQPLSFLKDLTLNENTMESEIYSMVSGINLSLEKKQDLFEIDNINDLLQELHIILRHEIDFIKLEKKIETDVSSKIMKEQKEYFLKEKLKGLRSEISGDGSEITEVDRIQELIANNKLTKAAKNKSLNDIEKLKRMHSMSPEFGLIRDFLDLVAQLPWKKSGETKVDIESAETILDEDHFGLAKPKERIIEYLSILKLKKKIKGPILCLVGPPGTGKTSLGKSVARALNREYIRVALGGVHDEAEIRGHRRTYIGAMPGKIIQSIKKAGVNNPLFLLDEIDKLSTDFRGDPASALLEVLDPEQNNSFVDNYLDVEFDLSNVLFIATANDKSRIPKPLFDRMETIELDGYLDVEKYHIAKDFIIKKQISENGLSPEMIEISDEAIYKIIADYTMEAGVRELERKIAKICRKVAREYLKGEKNTIKVTVDNLEGFLGIPRFYEKTMTEGEKIGEVNGLAWTVAGGTILKVETNLMDGKPALNLTGKLGEVMKESAQAALSYIRANSMTYDIKPSIFENTEIHIHFPEGAVPKDGPSAGITIVTSLISALKNIPIEQNIGMTGEVTIHGDVLPIGGLNSKLMAAKRAGIKKVFIPSQNKKELSEISSEITNSLEIIAVKHIKEVLANALGI